MNWREHLRVIAMLLNAVFVPILVGLKIWHLPLGIGVPLVVYPLLAVFALAVNGRQR
jgi:hypothetical protein